MEVQDLGPEEFLGIKDATDLVGGAEDVAVTHSSSPSGTTPDGRSPGHNGSYEGRTRADNKGKRRGWYRIPSVCAHVRLFSLHM